MKKKVKKFNQGLESIKRFYITTLLKLKSIYKEEKLSNFTKAQIKKNLKKLK